MKEMITRMAAMPTKMFVREPKQGDSRTITGYAILFNTPSAVLYSDDDSEIREVIAPSAVTRSLLDSSDIKMTMFHDRQLLLARSRNGVGTLKYGIDSKGVHFSFDAPHTADGDKAVELVRRGDITGCSFMFSTFYYDKNYVQRTSLKRGGKTITTCKVVKVTGIYDFTLAADPAYPSTSCGVRDARGTGNTRDAIALDKCMRFISQMERMRMAIKSMDL